MEQVINELKAAKELINRVLLQLEGHLPELEDGRLIAWGKKVPADFKAGVLWIEQQLGLNADYLMACMAFETGGTFDPAIKNMAGSSGLGLIQFMKSTHTAMVRDNSTLRQLAPNHSDLARLSALQQLSFVYYYFKQFGSDFSDWTVEDVYMAILFPRAIGKAPDWPMPWKYGELAYKQNSGLDLNKDRTITKAEAAAGVTKKLALGLQQKG